MEKERFIAAVVQAWCTPENENKIMDPTLVDAIVKNIEKLFERQALFD